MPDNQTIAMLEQVFKEKKLIGTSKQFAELIGENANGLSDIKAGRKKFTIDHIRSLKNSHPDLNVDWIITGDGEVFNKKNQPQQNDVAAELDRLKKDNSALIELNLMLGRQIFASNREVIKEG